MGALPDPALWGAKIHKAITFKTALMSKRKPGAVGLGLSAALDSPQAFTKFRALVPQLTHLQNVLMAATPPHPQAGHAGEVRLCPLAPSPTMLAPTA